MVCVFIVWYVIDSAPALDAPAFSHLLLKGFSGSADADPGLADLLRRFIGAQHLDDAIAVADLMIHRSVRDLVSSLVLLQIWRCQAFLLATSFGEGFCQTVQSNSALPRACDWSGVGTEFLHLRQPVKATLWLVMDALQQGVEPAA